MNNSLPNDAIERVKHYLLDLQNHICQALEQIDTSACFYHDNWQRELGGGGDTRILNGQIFTKAGVNFSHVFGNQLPASATAARPQLSISQFNALGVSVVIHPNNPFVPTAHANVRFFVAERPNLPPIWWFGGGYDLTPYYGFIEDCQHWHQTAYKACQPFGDTLYSRLKQWCDEYFYIQHRQEPRGIGGLFFDDFNEKNFEHSFAFMQSIGNSFTQAYIPIAQKRIAHPFGLKEKEFQRYRRGRYVEFNLVYDRGTLFGLQSNGRTESILMSLPPEVSWHYNWQPEDNSPEAELYTTYLKPRDWLKR